MSDSKNTAIIGFLTFVLSVCLFTEAFIMESFYTGLRFYRKYIVININT
jgi:hypothetical protein